MPTRPTIPQYAINGLPMLPKLGEYIRPNTRRQDRLNSLNQIQASGNFMLQPPVDDASGVVYAGGQPLDAGGYVAPQGIPGTARPTTPVVPGQSYGNDNVMQQEVIAKTPWFTQPWGAASQEGDLPWWQRGMKGAA